MSGRFWLISVLAVMATVLVGFKVIEGLPEKETVNEISLSEELVDYGELKKMMVGNNSLYVEVADESEEMRLGLGGRQSLGFDRGMLFVYPQDLIPRFWMKGMQFSLDFLWIRDGVVVEILENVPSVESEDDLEIFTPAELVDMVLEVNAGWVKENNVWVGDEMGVWDSK